MKCARVENSSKLRSLLLRKNQHFFRQLKSCFHGNFWAWSHFIVISTLYCGEWWNDMSWIAWFHGFFQDSYQTYSFSENFKFMYLPLGRSLSKFGVKSCLSGLVNWYWVLKSFAIFLELADKLSFVSFFKKFKLSFL